MRKAGEHEPLTDTERIEFSAIHGIFFRGFEDSEWEGMLETIGASLASEYAQEDWRAYRRQYSPPLRAIIDPLVPNYDDPSQTPKYNIGMRRKEKQ
ncbi:MAG: hypothetical protein DRR06_18110 [Gammaproteobacteria bacterium]|nr:MAG: hypothetical protein DRR06_18110 [Gammaproteobacteria bacterium]RLA54332.1 MAG: hypothetical protein DRR42_02120 [Gammaproteobacteria bacterium]